MIVNKGSRPLLNCEILIVSARLPFKRLNPEPKGKCDVNPGVKKTRIPQNIVCQSIPSSLSQDDVENSCQVETEAPCVPKLIGGKGPLDNFVQKTVKYSTAQPLLLIDLTDDSISNHGLDDGMDNDKLRKDVSSAENVNEEMGSKSAHSHSQKLSCNGQGDALMETEPLASEAANMDELSNTTFAKIEAHRAKDCEIVKSVIFERKMPVVVLEDIMAARSLQVVPSGNDTLESCPQEETTCTNSSLSSLSSTSSPEALPPHEHKNEVSPLAASTPVRKVSICYKEVPKVVSGSLSFFLYHAGGGGLFACPLFPPPPPLTAFASLSCSPRHPSSLSSAVYCYFFCF